VQRSSLRPENSLTARLLRREALQLGVIAVASAAVLAFHSRTFGIVAGIVDIGACLLAAVALAVAWRAAARGGALGIYAGAILVFAVLAFLNLT
jgi:hypothetical protein